MKSKKQLNPVSNPAATRDRKKRKKEKPRNPETEKEGERKRGKKERESGLRYPEALFAICRNLSKFSPTRSSQPMRHRCAPNAIAAAPRSSIPSHHASLASSSVPRPPLSLSLSHSLSLQKPLPLECCEGGLGVSAGAWLVSRRDGHFGSGFSVLETCVVATTRSEFDCKVGLGEVK